MQQLREGKGHISCPHRGTSYAQCIHRGISYEHTGTSYMPDVYARQRGGISCVAHGIYHSLFIGSQFIQGDIVYEV